MTSSGLDLTCLGLLFLFEKGCRLFCESHEINVVLCRETIADVILVAHDTVKVASVLDPCFHNISLILYYKDCLDVSREGGSFLRLVSLIMVIFQWHLPNRLFLIIICNH